MPNSISYSTVCVDELKIADFAPPVPFPISVLTTDLERVEAVAAEAAVPGLRLEALFPKELPIPTSAAAVVIDLDFLCMDEHEKRRYVAHQLLQPQHPLTAIVSQTLDWDTTLLHNKSSLGGFCRLDIEVLEWLKTRLVAPGRNLKKVAIHTGNNK